MIITFKGVDYEIPIQNEHNLTFVIDDTFDNGVVTTEPLTDDYGDLDVKRRIPRGLLVTLERDSKTFYFKTGETQSNQVSFVNGKYEHTINLVSLTRDLTRLTCENMTITQPKGDLGTYSRSVNVGNITIGNNVTPYDISFINTINTNISKFDVVEIISTGETYKVTVESYFTYLPTIFDTNIDIYVEYNNTILKQETITFPAKLAFTNQYLTYNITFDITPSVSSEFEVYFVRNSALGVEVDTSVALSITSVETIDLPVRTYAQACDKILRQTNYILSAETRGRINTLTCPEHKFESYMVYDALQTLASDLGALVKVGDTAFRRYWKSASSGTPDYTGNSVGDFNPYDYELGTLILVGTKYYENAENTDVVREIDFKFFDRPRMIDVAYNTRHEIAELEDYVSAVELDTKNVVKPLRYSPYKGGWKGVRSNGIGKQTTENILYELEDKGDRLITVNVKGLASQNAGSTITWSETDETTLTYHENPLSTGYIQSHIVNKMYYDTLSSEKDVSLIGKGILKKHNCLYHEQGSNFIQGLTYLGEDLSQVVGSPNVIRAWVETILAVRSEEAGELITRTGTQSADDEGLDGDLKLKFQVIYANVTESRARVYKDDQSGFEQETIKYMNESANINESQAIGDYAQLIVNRLGGTKIVYRGITDSLDDLPDVGDIDSDGRVYTLVKLTFSKRIKYEIVAVQDYNVISSYIGIKSAHRNQEVSSSDSVNRTLRWTSKIFITDTPQSFSTRLISSSDIFASLFENTDLGVNYGYLECNFANGETKKIHLSIDSDSKGKTIEIKWNLKDNYSAGLQRYMEVIDTEDVYLNRDVSYTDLYGKVNDILLFLYYDANAFSSADDEAYPEAITNKGDTLFTVVTDYIDKDAREAIGGLIEIPLFSESDEVRVYNGFAKYNKVVEGSDRIQTALLKYTPRKNDKLVDPSRIVDMALSSYDYSFGQFSFTFTAPESGNGVVWYNIDTLELVMAYVADVESGAQSVEKYYRVLDSLFGGGYNIITQIIIGHTLDMTDDVAQGYLITESMDFDVSVNVQLGVDVSVEFSQTIDMTNDIRQGYVLSEELTFSPVINTILGIDVLISVLQSVDVTPVIKQGYVLNETAQINVLVVAPLGTNALIEITPSVDVTPVIRQGYELTENVSVIADIDVDTPQWLYTTETSYDFTVTYATSGSTCATFKTILTWLKANYSANQYGVGARVRVMRNIGYLCSPVYYYYIVV